MPPRRRPPRPPHPTLAALSTRAESVESKTPTVGPVVQEDDVQEKLEKAYLGSVIVDIRILNQQWEGTTRNRAINQNHVDKLVTQFENGIKRFALEDRLKGTVKNATFGRMLQLKVIADKGCENKDPESNEFKERVEDFRDGTRQQTGQKVSTY